jgi:hypothetical protein
MSKIFFSKEEVISLVDNYNDYCVCQIKQYCDKDEIPEIEEFVEEYFSESLLLDEEAVKVILDDWKSCLKSYTGILYTEEEMKFFQKRTGVSYKWYKTLEFLNKYIVIGSNFWKND